MLARARLEARRRGDRLPFAGATDELRALLTLCGLIEVVELDPADPANQPDETDRPRG